MIHLVLLAVVISVAWGCRWGLPLTGSSWGQRWVRTLRALVLPPLLVMMTLVAILWMGPQGEMVGTPSDGLSYALAWGLLGTALGLAGLLGWKGWRATAQLKAYELGWIGDQPIRILETTAPFAAQVGFWQPELVVSRGLLTTLSPEHLQAVVIHEQAHHHYRDTFWFFWLGWIRSLGAWMPSSCRIWEELLMLRELRADRWAAERVDPLVLAEALLQVVTPEGHRLLREVDMTCAAAVISHCQEPTALDRLEERIQSLLEGRELDVPQFPPCVLPWISLILIPLLTIPLHR